MRRGAIINKKRVIETCIAKGNDTRVDMTDPLNPVYPMFRYRNLSINEAISTANGELLVRSSIVKDNSQLNTSTQLIPNMASFGLYIGDNKPRNEYPAGLLELHHRVHKTQVSKIQLFVFRFNSSPATTYQVNYLDFEKFIGSKGLRTLDDNVTVKVEYLNLKKAVNFISLVVTRHNFTLLDISDNTLLQSIHIGNDTAGNIEEVITNNATYNELYGIDLSYNKLVSFDIDAPNLISLALNFNPTLNSINFDGYPNLENLNVIKCGLTSLDLSYNTLLKTIVAGNSVTGNTNNLTNQVDISNCILLENLQLISCGLTGLDVSNNTELNALNISTLFGQTLNKNDFGTNLVGLYNLTKLKSLQIGSANITMTNFDLEFFPELTSFLASNNTNLIGSLLTTTDKPFLTNIDVSATGINFFNTNHTPNLGRLIIRFFNQIDFTVLTKLYQLNCDSTSSGTLTVIDLRNGTIPMTILQVISNSVVTALYLPPTQVTNFTCYSCNNLSTFVINSISRTNTTLYITNLALATLDTSFGATNCFPNLIGLAVGGTNDTYTSTKVFDDRKNNLITLVVLGTHFQVNGNLGTDTLTSATLINVEGDSDLSYTGSGTFGATMRRVFLRPKTGSGLATDGNQVANLIIDLSLKTWSASGTNSIAGSNYASRIIDLRGNCAVATASGSLTTALNLLTTKGVSVLRNT